MNYKLKGALKRSKNAMIVFIILWVAISIVLVSSITVSIVEAKQSSQSVLEILFSCIGNIGENLGKIFKGEYIGTFWKTEGYTTIALLILSLIGFFKSMPKNEYTDIEHGSSDWATGEQYSVLNRNKGILLAEKHYLPLDKRGNTNVLVVGRIWFW